MSEYLAQFSELEQQKINQIRALIKKTIDSRFQETIMYNMINYVIPKKLYPAGYHVNSKLPLSYIALAQQKNYFSFYHLGVDAIPEAVKKFENEYFKQYSKKLDHGKVCFRFKNNFELPYKLIQNLLSAITFDEFLDWYKAVLSEIESKRSKK